MNYPRTMHLVSIVIPCFNAAKYIEECLDSIAAQTYEHIEIIIVNDGSTDNTNEVIQSWKQKKEIYNRFIETNKLTLLSLPYNIGYAGAYTTGFFLTKGEFIANQDADDLSHPTRIEKQIQFLREQPKYGMVGTHYAKFIDGNFNKQKKAGGWLKYGYNNIKERYMNGKGAMCHGTLLFRGRIFDRYGGHVRKLKTDKSITGHDTLFIAKCIQAGVKVDNIPEVLYYYRLHSSQMSGKKDLKWAKE